MPHLRRCVAVVLALLWCGLASAADEKPEFKVSKEEQEVLDLTNKARAKENLPPLKPNAQLFEAARAHSANMAKKGEMKHELDGKNPAQRVTDTGYKYSQMGENIASGMGWSASDVVLAWMDSEDHRKNILKPEFEEIGIGIAKDDKGDSYYTQVFGTPRKKR